MNYQKIYDSLIIQAKNRILEVDGELHHIKPKSLGGSNDEENLVKLTGKEHFVAHHLLAKILGGKMNYAFWMMCNMKYKNRDYVVSARIYESARKVHSRNASEFGKTRTHSEETKKKMRISQKGIKPSLEAKKKMRLAKLGVEPWNKGTKGVMKAWNKDNTKFIFHNKKENYSTELSLHEFAEEYNYNLESVRLLINGTRKTFDKKTWTMGSI